MVSVPFYTEYQPGFLYNGNCSNATFINYIPINILVFMITAFVFPILYIIVMKYPLYEILPEFLGKNLPGVFWPEKFSEFKSILRVENVLSTYVSHTAVLFTFGTISPLLTITIIVALGSEIFCYQLLIWRFVKQCRDNTSLKGGIERVESECKDAWRTPKNTIWGMLMFCSLFYAFICFDMGYDDYRTHTSYAYIWTAMLSFFFPPLLYLSIHAARYGRLKEFHNSEDNIQRCSVSNPLVTDASSNIVEVEISTGEGNHLQEGRVS